MNDTLQTNAARGLNGCGACFVNGNYSAILFMTNSVSALT